MSGAAQARLCPGIRRRSVDRHDDPPRARSCRRWPSRDKASRPTILTWGLIGPGKGIERVMTPWGRCTACPRPRYLVAGQTHPQVLAADGEAYRNARIEQAVRNGVEESVGFDATYRDVASLTALSSPTRLSCFPTTRRTRSPPAFCVDAIAAGRPVIATAFPHAVELLASGAGIVVDHNDPDALVSALRRDPRRARARGQSMATRPRGWRHRWPGRSSPAPTWGLRTDCSASTRPRYDRRRSARVRPPFEDDEHTRGTFEHAQLGEVGPEHGYCTDDMARVLVVATREPSVARSARARQGPAFCS